jgi:hypothetical protein
MRTLGFRSSAEIFASVSAARAAVGTLPRAFEDAVVRFSIESANEHATQSRRATLKPTPAFEFENSFAEPPRDRLISGLLFGAPVKCNLMGNGRFAHRAGPLVRFWRQVNEPEKRSRFGKLVRHGAASAPIAWREKDHV